MLIKKDVLRHTQACSDKVIANVGSEGFFFFLKVTVSLFIKVTFNSLLYIERQTRIALVFISRPCCQFRRNFRNCFVFWCL